MKKFFYLMLGVASLAVFNVYFNAQQSELSGLSLANVEALAQEITGPVVDGYTRSPRYRYNPQTANLEIVGWCCFFGGTLTSCSSSNCNL